MKIRVISIVVFMFFGGFILKSQTSATKNKLVEASPSSDVVVKPELAQDNQVGSVLTEKQDLNSTLPGKEVYTEGQIPTPEQQGFTKHVVNSKEIYIKEQGQVKQVYTPKK